MPDNASVSMEQVNHEEHVLPVEIDDGNSGSSFFDITYKEDHHKHGLGSARRKREKQTAHAQKVFEMHGYHGKDKRTMSKAQKMLYAEDYAPNKSRYQSRVHLANAIRRHKERVNEDGVLKIEKTAGMTKQDKMMVDDANIMLGFAKRIKVKERSGEVVKMLGAFKRANKLPVIDATRFDALLVNEGYDLGDLSKPITVLRNAIDDQSNLPTSRANDAKSKVCAILSNFRKKSKLPKLTANQFDLLLLDAGYNLTDVPRDVDLVRRYLRPNLTDDRGRIEDALLQSGIEANPGPPLRDDMRCKNAGKKVQGEAHPTKKNKWLCPCCAQHLTNVSRTGVGQHPNYDQTFSTFYYFPDDASAPAMPKGKEREHSAASTSHDDVASTSQATHIPSRVVAPHTPPVTSTATARVRENAAAPSQHNDAVSTDAIPHMPTARIEPPPPPPVVQPATVSTLRYLRPVMHNVPLGDGVVGFNNVPNLFQNYSQSCLKGTLLVLADRIAVSAEATRHHTSRFPSWFISGMQSRKFGPLFTRVCAEVHISHKIYDKEYTTDDRIASNRNVEEIKESLRLAEMATTISMRPWLALTYTLTNYALVQGTMCGIAVTVARLLKLSSEFRAVARRALIRGVNKVVPTIFARTEQRDWSRVPFYLFAGISLIHLVSSALRLRELLESSTTYITYCPHMVTCVMLEYDRGTNADAVRTTIAGKCRRLASLPIPAEDMVAISRGTEIVTARLLESESFFTEEAVCMRLHC